MIATAIPRFCMASNLTFNASNIFIHITKYWLQRKSYVNSFRNGDLPGDELLTNLYRNIEIQANKIEIDLIGIQSGFNGSLQVPPVAEILIPQCECSTPHIHQTQLSTVISEAAGSG